MIGRVVLDLLFPPRCILCHRFLPHSREPVCEACAGKILTQPGQIYRGEQFTHCRAPFVYEDPVRRSIHRFKFGGRDFYASTYAAWMAALLVREGEGDCDLITYVPSGKQSKRERGYDQAELLARELAKLLEIPMAALLRSVGKRPSQRQMPDAQARRDNVKNAFAVRSGEEISGKRVLLVDDVITTGATLESCAKMLKKAGAAEVLCITVAMTKQ